MLFNINDVSNASFDYIICGGGTSGLTLAGRLSEDPNISVVVLEAGLPNLNDDLIRIPAQIGHTFGNPKYDWAFQTTPQRNALNVSYPWNRGKNLGGSSTMNFYAWIKPPRQDIDAIEQLGNPGWSWDDYAKYSRLSETFHASTKEQNELYPYTHNPAYRGAGGPVQVTVPYGIHTVDKVFQETLKHKGIKAIDDPYGGDISGTWMASASLDPRSWTRSDAATAYYTPNEGRANLTVLTEATVARVIFSDAEEGKDLTATGVEFIHGGKTMQVHAKKEVILSAGAIKSPQILELSGIGRKEVLEKIGVDVKIELPGVGENAQEHVCAGIAYELNPSGGHQTLDLLRDPEYAAEAKKLHARGLGMHRVGVSSFAYFSLSTVTKEAPALIEKAAAEIEALKNSGTLAPGLGEQLDIQLAALRDDAVPDMEILAFPSLFKPLPGPEPGKSYFTAIFFGNHPISRGTIHATTADPLTDPEIDPRYFSSDFDLEILVQHFKYIRTLSDTEPWKSTISRETDPGPEVQTDDQIRKFILESLSTAWHTVGTTSMLPREKQGVVSPELKVYGTTNLRVVDIGVIPLHIAAHMNATAYVVGEKAADIIRGIVRK